jgi:RNA polymerase sigma factor (TIGR02999 family)
MSSPPRIPRDDVTGLLNAWGQGDPSAREDLFAIVYAELRKRAVAKLRHEHAGHTLSPTEVVHEAYLRLAKQRAGWKNRDQFYAIACQVMRRVLVDYARARQANKRAGLRVTLTEALAIAPDRDLDLLTLDAALTELQAANPRQSRLVELRFFGGLSLEEAAEAMSISLATANRDWRFGRAWLFRRLSGRTSA